MLGVANRTVRMPWRNTVVGTRPNEYNIRQHPQMLDRKFDHFQTCANNTQHVATGWPNARSLVRAKML